MVKNLLIVESPAKAKTIGKYLGKDFEVLSSIGHIRVIPKKPKNGKPAIDVDNDFKTQYEVDPDKRKTVSELKKAVKEAETVWLATDEDREGEAIAWHLCEVLKLDPAKTNRIVFHEITKDAITDAIKHPRTIDMNLVQAQQARQTLDHIVGFELSPVVWRKVPGGKSAGRVQSPALKLLVEREDEINNFKADYKYKVTADFTVENKTGIIKASLDKSFDDESTVLDLFDYLKKSDYKIANISTNPGYKNSGSPFTTSTLQQEANAKLNFSTKATMASAQRLYQSGKITYIRTDSVHLDEGAINSIKNYIVTNFGEKYSKPKQFRTTSLGAQEAHEAIRPTNIVSIKASDNVYDQKLYNLIRNHTIASQMAPAKIEKTAITIVADKATNKYSAKFIAKGEAIIFDGFLRAFGKGGDSTNALPKVSTNDILKFKDAIAKQTYSKAPARYTEGSLVKKMEDLGIGRPSTYATIITTLLDRGYVEKGRESTKTRESKTITLSNNKIAQNTEEEATEQTKGKLIPTDRGKLINSFLVNNFSIIDDYGFTAKIEKEFDQIATNSLKRSIMLKRFYGPFHKLITESANIDRKSVLKVRELGIDSKTKKPIFVRYAKYGPVFQLGEISDDSEKPKFAPLPKTKSIDEVTLEDAVKAFELPRLVGKTDAGDDIIAQIGPYGPYIKVKNLFVSIGKNDPHTIDLKTALQLYQEKLAANSNKIIKDFGKDIQVLRGRFGPYITDGKKNYKISKSEDPEKLTLEKAMEIINTKTATSRKYTSHKK